MGNTRKVRASENKLLNSHARLCSATAFLAFMGFYTTFLGPITNVSPCGPFSKGSRGCTLTPTSAYPWAKPGQVSKPVQHDHY